MINAEGLQQELLQMDLDNKIHYDRPNYRFQQNVRGTKRLRTISDRQIPRQETGRVIVHGHPTDGTPSRSACSACFAAGRKSHDHA